MHLVSLVAVIKQRSDQPLLSPEFAFEFGTPPYTCNVPNVIFLEAARPLGNDSFEVGPLATRPCQRGAALSCRVASSCVVLWRV